ncbi:putative cdc42-interacting protein 4 [Scophthalmus maximus]|uniref:Putative cdc42-interacting protein 4 n=1 Tax=Scophthalmus maximus TaxID=52904 RepID=A0A2U9BNC5_SCOMX|nr:putative cdc42-interacting protein 4 [Scophthalmus maximus]
MEVTLLVALLVSVASARSDLQSHLFVDCNDIYRHDNTSSSGVYAIYPGGPTTPVHVYCDMDTDGGRWTVFQRRMNGNENFYRPWKQYKTGFGNVAGEYWLGLENIHLMSLRKGYELRVDMESWENEKAHAKYESFSVDSESTGYLLHLGSFVGGDAGDSFSNHGSMKFTTYDRDQDQWEKNCAQHYLGGFWYKACHMANPNGMYAPNGAIGFENVHVIWHAWKGWNYSLKSVSMKDQYDVIDKHTQSGLDLVDRYIKFVKERTEIEQSYAKQLRSLTKKYAKRGSKEEQECNCPRTGQSFHPRTAKQHAHARTHTAEECRNDYAAQLQKYNKEQNFFYYSEIPQIFNKLQDMDERRIRRLAEGYCQFSDIEKKVLPIISKCLEGISTAGVKIQEKQDSILFIEQHKSGFERPADVDFEDYTQGIKPATSDSSLNPPKVRVKLWPFSKKNKPTAAEDFSHLPPEQRKKRLQAKIDEISKELQKTQDQSDALEKMKGVYERNPQMGDPSSLEPQITETTQNIGRLRGELAKYESWLSEAVGGEESANAINNNTQHGVVAANQSHNIYTEFEDEFDDVESPIGQCTALYTFEGNSEGTISVTEGEMLSIMEEDKGDGWMRVLRATSDTYSEVESERGSRCRGVAL